MASGRSKLDSRVSWECAIGTWRIAAYNMNGWRTKESAIDCERNRMLKYAIREEKIDILGIQEHHMRKHEEIQSNMRTWEKDNFGYIAPEATIEREGVTILWDSRNWKLTTSMPLTSRIMIAVLQGSGGSEITIVSGHMPNDPTERRKLWMKVSKLEIPGEIMV